MGEADDVKVMVEMDGVVVVVDLREESVGCAASGETVITLEKIAFLGTLLKLSLASVIDGTERKAQRRISIDPVLEYRVYTTCEVK
ncbi:hypothetical protein [Paenibacillus paeoniae]|nr:hypothetical protein [Paenibacillus paeoniae]